MTDILHCPSKQKGTIMEYHHGKKYYTVKTETSGVQKWAAHSIKILNEGYMTSKILMKLTGSRGKMYNVIDKVFDSVEDAAIYLGELTRLDPIKEHDKTGQVITLANGWSISCNYDLREILKKKPPKKDLMDWYPFDLQQKMKRSTPKNMPYRLTNPDEAPTLSSSRKPATGKMIKLQDLTKDGRGARVILRELVRKKKITKAGRWEWPEGSPDLEIVKEALKGK